jgi:hypothetical protein
MEQQQAGAKIVAFCPPQEFISWLDLLVLIITIVILTKKFPKFIRCRVCVSLFFSNFLLRQPRRV